MTSQFTSVPRNYLFPLSAKPNASNISLCAKVVKATTTKKTIIDRQNQKIHDKGAKFWHGWCTRKVIRMWSLSGSWLRFPPCGSILTQDVAQWLPAALSFTFYYLSSPSRKACLFPKSSNKSHRSESLAPNSQGDATVHQAMRGSS